MPITIEFSPADVQIIRRIAEKNRVTMAQYIHELTINAIHENEEMEEIDRRLEQVRNGKVVFKSMEELEEMEN
ncbi:MAG: hypothetical protein IKN43_11220 [Selenomonadaceae bacterium]|nr:hypothetical protein [Selenomonadaceae bacterium]